MFVAKIIRMVRDELKKIDFNYNGEINVLKIKEDVVFLSLENEGNSYIVEYSNNGDLEQKYKNKVVLENYGINTGVVIGSSHIIVYVDYITCRNCRFATNEDFNNEAFIKKLARWYKTFHSIKGLVGGNYKEYFCKENIRKVRDRFNLINNNFIKFVESNFDNIKLKLERLEEVFSIKSICVENMVISKENYDFIMVDFENVYNGYRALDISNIFSFLNNEMKTVFCEEYGTVKDDEFIVNDIVMTVVNLFLNSEKKVINQETRKCLNLIMCEDMYEKAKVLVNWY